MSKKLVEVRDQFSKVLNDPAHLNAKSRDIAAAFLNSHRSLIPADAWDEVTISGLVQMMGGLRKRRPPVKADGTPDLFANSGIEPIVIVRVVEDSGAVVEKNKGLPSLTLPEAMDCLARQTKERIADGKKIRAWRKLITRVRPFMTEEGMTLEEGLRAAEAHEAAKKKKK